jgi:hypothetical protein
MRPSKVPFFDGTTFSGKWDTLSIAEGAIVEKTRSREVWSAEEVLGAPLATSRDEMYI